MGGSGNIQRVDTQDRWSRAEANLGWYSEDGIPALIDFDSCTQVGEFLRNTHEWHNPDVDNALNNDLETPFFLVQIKLSLVPFFQPR